MTKASVDLQDLRRRIYVKAKAETSWRFWGLYVHVCKLDTLREAYALAKKNDGAPGSDGVTFEAIEAQGVEAFLGQIADELVGRTYVPLPARKQEIPKDGGKVRVLSIPAIRDRVVQGALKLILEPIFEADSRQTRLSGGDGSLIEFRSVVDAVRCAIEVQNGLLERNAGVPVERRIEFRVGIHLGDVVEEADGDLMGFGRTPGLQAVRGNGRCPPN
jgi:hypothetical protein